MKTEIKKRAPGARVPASPEVQQVVYQSDVTPTANGNYIRIANDVKANLAALDGAIQTGGAGSVVTINTAQTPDTGYLTTYEIWQGDTSVPGNLKGKINIPKDFLVKSATMGTVTAVDKAAGGKFENDSDYSVGDKYIDFVLNTADSAQGTGTDKHVYINVNTLVDTYTAAQGATQVQLAISNANEISATIVAGSITETELATDAVTTAKIADGNVTKAKLAQTVQDSLDAADAAVKGVTLGLNGGSATSIVDSGTKIAALTVASGTTNGTIAVNGTEVSVAGLGSAAYTDSTAYAASTHTHGSITNDGKIGSASGLAVVTGTDGAVTTADLTTAAPTTGSATDAVEFITSVSQGANGKLTASKEAVRDASASQSGLMSASDFSKLAAFGAASTYKTKQTAVSDPTVPSSGTTTALSFIDSISQDANGVITPTKKDIPTAVAAGSAGETNGLMTKEDKAKLDGITAGGEPNVLEAVKVNNTDLTITNKAVNLEVDGTYSSSNKIATVATVTDAIGGLDVTEYAQAAIDTTTTSGQTTVKISGIKETDGKIAAGTSTVDLVLDGTYNNSTNKVATQATVSNATSGKADKVSSPTSGNFAGLDSNGNLTDSGKKAADFKTVQTEVSDPTASGNAIAFIDSISQNANGKVTVTKKTVDTDNSTIEVSSSKLQVKAAGIDTAQLKDGAVETSKLAVLDSFQIRDTAQSGAYAGVVYTITIDNGILTITPNPAQSGS